jgi:hypothetical protein
MDTKHTGLPWLMQHNKRENRYEFSGGTPANTFGHFCGWSYDGITTEAEDDANADYIFRAVNHYPILLDACIAALSQLTEDRAEYLESDIKQLKDAIAAATKDGGA